MGELSVVIADEQPTRCGESCRDSLAKFAPELAEVASVSGDAEIGVVLRLVRTPFVAFLDARTAVSPGWAGRLIRALERSGAAAVGPLSNGAAGPQRREADYQDIEDYLTFAERTARDHDGRIQSVEALDPVCIVCRRELLTMLDPSAIVRELAGAIRAAGHRSAVALDTYLHSFSEYYRRDRPEIRRLVPADARTVLDVGCGAGALGAALKRSGATLVVGVEVDPAAAATAKGVLDRVHVGDIEALDLPYGAGTFDCIILADLLEHLRDPWELLRRLVPMLAARGRLIASLPNVRHWSVLRGLLQGAWSYLPAGILDQGHLRFFTRQSGRALLEAAGLTVLKDYPVCSGSVPDLTILVKAAQSLSLDGSTLQEEAQVAQYLYVAERRG